MRKLLSPTIATRCGLIVLLNLGFWQLNRLAWKETLIVQVEEGVSKPPVEAPGREAWPGLGEADDYRHVKVTGAFEPGAAYYYLALTNAAGPAEGPGMMVYSPFRTTDGWTVMVNRGFLPEGLPDDLKQAATKPPSGPMELTGILRLGEKPNWTTPEPSGGLWFARDTDAMAAHLGVDRNSVAPFSIDLDAAFTPAEGLPQAGETIVRFKNDHLGYALTWFGLAATLVGVFLTYAATVLWPRRQDQDEG